MGVFGNFLTQHSVCNLNLSQNMAELSGTQFLYLRNDRPHVFSHTCCSQYSSRRGDCRSPRGCTNSNSCTPGHDVKNVVED